jgi:predicted nucleotidyltransferase
VTAFDPARLVDRLARIGGVVAVCLGGSRARGEERPGSDWDFGLYYRGRIDTSAVRALGLTGEVSAVAQSRRLLGLGGPDGLKPDTAVRMGAETP